MASTEGLTRLITLLTRDAKVDKTVQEYITTTLQLESVADFSSLFTAVDYAKGVQEIILDQIPAHKTSILQLARLRTAWQLASADMSSALKRKGESTSAEELDAPLDQELRKAQDDEFCKLHNLTFEPEVTPAEGLYARLFREFRRQSITIHDLRKVRSASHQEAILPAKSRKLGNGLKLTIDGQDLDAVATTFGTPLEMLWAMQVLLNGIAICGSQLKDSHRAISSGKKIRDGHLPLLMAYHVFVHQKAMLHPGPPGATVAWLLDRDRQTRSAARTLFAQGWSYAEGIIEATERQCGVLWTCSSSRGASVALVPSAQQAIHEASNYGQEDGFSTPIKAARTTGKSKEPAATFGKAELCGAFNSAKGCKRKQKDCPQQKIHRCDFDMGNNKLCSSWNHSRPHCTSNPRRLVKGKSQ